MTNVTLITGDGIGPEIAQAARRCIDATGVKINWEICEAGTDVMERQGTPLPDATIESIKKNAHCAEGPDNDAGRARAFAASTCTCDRCLTCTPACRPCKSYKGVRSKYTDIDLVIVRENTEDLYAGVEFEKGKDETAELIDWLNKHSKKQIRQDSGISIKPISVAGHGADSPVCF